MSNKDIIKKQILDLAGNVQYTYSAHWNIVNRINKKYTRMKALQVFFTAITTTGLVGTIINGVSCLSWLGALCSAFSLFLNLILLGFRPTEEIMNHKNAADELWDVREAYKSLLVDFDDLEIEEIRHKRDLLSMKVSEINKKYPGTDEKSFAKAQKNISKYTFEKGESEKLLM